MHTTTTTAPTTNLPDTTDDARLDDRIDHIIDQMRRTSEQRRIPLREWRRQYFAHLLAEDDAWEVMYALYERNADGVLVQPNVDNPNEGAARQIFRDQVAPAIGARQEFYEHTMYGVFEQNDGGGQGHGTTQEESSKKKADRRAQVLEALGANNGCPKAQLLRAANATSKRDKQVVLEAFKALCDEGICRWESPPRKGLAGKCWRVAEGAEVVVELPSVD